MAEAKRFGDLETLVEALLSEGSFGTEGRFSVRLLLLPDFRHLRSFRKILINQGVKEVFLDDRIEDYIRWLYPETIAGIVKGISSEGSTVVLHSVSEAVRFYTQKELSDLILNKLFLIEGGRVFIPLAGMSERVLDIYRNFSRRGEYAPLYILEGEGRKLSLYLINPKLKLPFEPVKSFKEFLSLWMDREREEEFVAIKSLYINSENAKPDSAVDSIKIASYEDFLSGVLNFREHPFFKDDTFLEFLVAKAYKAGAKTFSDLLGDKAPEEFKEFLRLFLSEKDKNVRRLLVNYAYSKWEELRSFLDEDPYKLAQNIWFSTLNLNEKREYIKTMLEADPSMDRGLCETVKADIDKHNLVGVLSCEKVRAIELFSRGDISEEELRGVWQGFDSYLDTPVPSNLPDGLETLLEYIKEYKLCKLRNSLSDKLRELLSKLNSSEERFYEWYHRIEELKDLVEYGVRVIQLDGVGLEWAGFIVGILRERGLPIQEVKVARANLPTITETNKLEEATLIREFDVFIHEPARYPEYIVEEMERLHRIIWREIELSGGKLIITSDHGATALSRAVDALGFNSNGEKTRYVEEEVSVPDTLVFKGEGDKTYTVALTHRSISRKPAGEAHGGATPEEVLIPFIVVGEGTVSYRLELEREEITTRVLRFKLFPEPKISVYAKLEGTLNYELEVSKEGGWFVVKLPINIKAGNYDFKVYIGPQEVSARVYIRGGIKEKDLL